jgi:hypothetical protein
MRAALLIVALFGLVALASAQLPASTYTFSGSYYLDNACTGSTSYTFTAKNNYVATTYSCSVVGAATTGSTSYAINAYCYTYVVNYWYTYVYQAGVCPSSGQGVPTGSTTYGVTYGSDFTTSSALLGNLAGCVKPSGCSSGASTLIVPSILLAALAFAASKLQL